LPDENARKTTDNLIRAELSEGPVLILTEIRDRRP